MLFPKKIDRSLRWLRGQKPDHEELTEEQLSLSLEKGDYWALVLGAFKAFWPIFAVLIAIFLLVLFLF